MIKAEVAENVVVKSLQWSTWSITLQTQRLNYSR
jgi:hypothetical protein